MAREVSSNSHTGPESGAHPPVRARSVLARAGSAQVTWLDPGEGEEPALRELAMRTHSCPRQVASEARTERRGFRFLTEVFRAGPAAARICAPDEALDRRPPT